MELKDKAIGLLIEGITGESTQKQALFYYGDGPGADAATDFAPLRVLTEVPASLDGSLDLQSGIAELTATTFALSATDYVCQRLMVNAGNAEAPAALDQDLAAADSTPYVQSGRTIAAGDTLYTENETLYVSSVLSQTGDVYHLSVYRGAGASDAVDHDSGTAVYFSPPFVKLRRVEVVVSDLKTGAYQVVWQGLLDGLSTDDQQTEIVVSASEVFSVLRGATGGSRIKLDVSSTFWSRLGGADGVIAVPDGFDGWINQAKTGDFAVNLRIGDTATIGEYTAANDQIRLSRVNTWGTESEDVETRQRIDDEASLFLGWSRIEADDSVNDLKGIYGVSDAEAHPAAVALGLMLSTGQGTNNLTDPDTGATRTFDVLHGAWGMGVPAELIDAASWLEVIETVPLTIDRIQLGWDGDFDFEETIFKRLLLPNGLIPRDVDGKLGIRHLDTWSILDIAEISELVGTVTLNPTRIKVDRQLEKYATQIKATIGGIGPDEEADEPKLIETSGFRRDARLNQPDYTVDFSFFDKASYRENEDSSELFVRLRHELHKRKDNPPLLTCNVPLVTEEGTLNQQRLPSLGAFVRITGGPETGIIGPDGTRIQPDDTEITFIGLLVGKTLDFKTFDVEARVLMVNWWLGDSVPRLVAPAGLISSYDPATDAMVVTADLPAVDGGTGFRAGDDVQIRHAGGRRWYGDAGGLEVTAVDDATRTLTVAGITTAIGSGDDLYVTTAGFDSFSNSSWSGSGGYATASIASRLYAYLADSSGTLGASADDADIYA